MNWNQLAIVVLIGVFITINVRMIIGFLRANGPLEFSEFKTSILAIVTVGALFLAFISWIFDSDSNLISGLVGAFIGGIVGVLDKLASPKKGLSQIDRAVAAVINDIPKRLEHLESKSIPATVAPEKVPDESKGGG